MSCRVCPRCARRLARNAAWPRTQFSLIYEFIERHAAPAEAALREVREELGLTGDVASFIGHFPFTDKNELPLTFHLRARGALALGDEIVAAKRVPRAAIAPYDFTPFSFTAGIERSGQAGIAKASGGTP